MVTSTSVQPHGWSATARAPFRAPLATAERKRWRCSTPPTSRTMGANWVMVGSRGPGTTARPSSSTTTAVSTTESPTPPFSSGTARAGQSSSTIEAQSLSGVAPVSTTARTTVDRTFLVEKRTNRGAQFLLIAREFELHRPPSCAVPDVRAKADDQLHNDSRGSVSDSPLRLRPVLLSPHTVFWETARVPRGGRRSEADARTGGMGAAFTLPWLRVASLLVTCCWPTLSAAPLAQRQSNGLLIRRLGVQIHTLPGRTYPPVCRGSCVPNRPRLICDPETGDP